MLRAAGRTQWLCRLAISLISGKIPPNHATHVGHHAKAPEAPRGEHRRCPRGPRPSAAAPCARRWSSTSAPLRTRRWVRRRRPEGHSTPPPPGRPSRCPSRCPPGARPMPARCPPDARPMISRCFPDDLPMLPDTGPLRGGAPRRHRSAARPRRRPAGPVPGRRRSSRVRAPASRRGRRRQGGSRTGQRAAGRADDAGARSCLPRRRGPRRRAQPHGWGAANPGAERV